MDLDLARPYRLTPGVSIRPEKFGALLYSYHKRQLYFLYNRPLVAFMENLDGSQTLGAALDGFLTRQGLAAANKPVFVRALTKLKAMEVLSEL